MRAITNTFQNRLGSPARDTEVLKRACIRIAAASDKGRGLRLSAPEVRALDWAVIRESTIVNADDHWLASSSHQYLAKQEA